jgi:RNA polymerase-binding transcription factor DksA
MKAVQLKSDLHRLIDKVNDVDILKAVKTILTKESEHKSDWADSLSENLKTELQKSILEADQGKTVSDEEALKRIKSRYNL